MFNTPVFEQLHFTITTKLKAILNKAIKHSIIKISWKKFKGLVFLSVIYRNNLKNREFDKEAPQNLCSEQATIARAQGASENKNSEVKPTQSKTDSSGYFGIYDKFLEKWGIIDCFIT